MKKWRWSRYELKQFDVVKETEKQVIYRRPLVWGREGEFEDIRESKSSRSFSASVGTHHMWFDTWEDAHTWMIERATEKMHYASRVLETAKNDLVKIQAMQKPEE